jgi:hypothetical protein
MSGALFRIFCASALWSRPSVRAIRVAGLAGARSCSAEKLTRATLSRLSRTTPVPTEIRQATPPWWDRYHRGSAFEAGHSALTWTLLLLAQHPQLAFQLLDERGSKMAARRRR